MIKTWWSLIYKKNEEFRFRYYDSITKAEETGNEFIFNDTIELNKKVDLKNYNIDEFNLFNTWLEKDHDYVRQKIKTKYWLCFIMTNGNFRICN